MPEPQAFLSIKTQFDNVGDALINREMIRNAARLAQVTVDVSRAPAGFRSMLDLEGKGYRIPHNIRDFLRDIFVSRMKGGKVLYFTTPGGMRGEVSAKGFLKGLGGIGMLYLFRLAGIRTIATGCSFESLGPRHLRLVKLRRGALSYLAPRDSLSLRYLEAHGIRADAIIPDLAFGLYLDDATPAQTGPRPTIAFSVRTDQYEGQAEEYLEKIRLEVAKHPVDTPVLMVAQVGRDVDFARTAAKRLRLTHGRADFIDVSRSIEDCLGVYRTCNTVHSNRLHALLMAGSQGADIIPWASDEANRKIIGLFQDMGMLSGAGNAGDEEPVRISGQEILARGAACRAEMESKWQTMVA